MSTPISVQDKKRFITWFLNHCKLKKQESAWVLDYLLQHDHLLTNVHFVTDVKNYPKGMIMTCRCSNEIDFRFHKKHIMTDDIDKSFHDIRLHPNERMYIQVNFDQANNNPFYTSILEDQFFAHENKQIMKADQDRAKQVLRKVMNQYQEERLQKQINRALDQRDEEQFIRLTNEWIKFKKKLIT